MENESIFLGIGMLLLGLVVGFLLGGVLDKGMILERDDAGRIVAVLKAPLW